MTMSVTVTLGYKEDTNLYKSKSPLSLHCLV
jgi:hypothetical protein